VRTLNGAILGLACLGAQAALVSITAGIPSGTPEFAVTQQPTLSQELVLKRNDPSTVVSDPQPSRRSAFLPKPAPW
jgi:hypothetical protein